MNEKFLRMLGLCMRAGRLVSGETGVLSAIRKGTAALVIVDDAASDNTKKMFSDSCSYYGVPMIFSPADALGSAIGRGGRRVAAVQDEGFARELSRLSETNI